ncbi:RimK family alpha-L-glutamate ligase [Arthrobacter sp. GCM10027362]|uniref:ATP-grasp domain-containing protein n=1 Tax=Arthrobacter sp. GCM10027362 TaxID=3273379 RepID=UPI00363C0D52
MRICFLSEPPRSARSVTYDVIACLESGGANVDIVNGRSGLIDLGRLRLDYDAYLFKSHAPLAESIAAAAHYQGGTILNGYLPTMKVRDKILSGAMLLQAGIPAPRTFVAGSVEALRSVARQMPIVVKPYRGHRGAGIEICRDEAEFDAFAARAAAGDGGQGGADDDGEGTRIVFAQQYVECEPFDYKAYAIGGYVHAIRRVFPAATQEEKEGTPVGDDPELAGLVRRCGKLFGLELYGVDLVKTPKGYSVIEVNCFPGYKGVPDAGRRIAGFILERCR